MEYLANLFLPWNKLASITTGWAPALTGENVGLINLTMTI